MCAFRRLLSLAFVLACLITTSYSQIPRTMTFQGLLTDNLNVPLPNNTYNVTFGMYDASTGASALWTESHLVTTHDGVFDVILGSTNPFMLAFDRPYWLGITLAGQPEFDPRLALSSVPYAMTANTALNVSPNATGAVLSLNGAQGVLTMQGAGGTTVSIVGNAITIESNHAAITELTSPDGTIAIANPQGPSTIVSLADGSVTLAKLAPGLTIPLSGNAGGDLTGTYPNPTIAPGVVNNTKLADNAVTSAKIADNAVTTSELANGAVTTPKLANAAVTTEKLVDGAITNAKLGNNAVTSDKIADGAITTAKLAAGSVTSDKLAPTGVTSGTYGAPNETLIVEVDNAGRVVSVQSIPISGVSPGGAAGGDLVGIYPNPEIALNAVTTSKVADFAITALKLADNSVTTSKVADGSITSAKLSSTGVNTGTYGNATTVAQVTVDAAGRVVNAVNVPITGVSPSGNAGGDLSGTYPNPTIASNAITNLKLADNAVTTPKLADGAVTSIKLSDGAITAAKIADGTITSSKLTPTGVVTGTYGNSTNVSQVTIDAAGRVTAATNVPISGVTPGGGAGGDLTGTYPNPTVKAGAIDNSKLADNAVTTSKIADGSVTAEKLADGALTTSKIADGAITSAKLSPTGVTSGTYGNATNVSQVTIDAAGRVTSAANVLITGVTPGGDAGGDLAGSYPNPTIASNAITTAKLAEGAVTNTKLADGSVTNNKIVNGTITSDKLAPSGVATGTYGNATNVSQVTIDASGRVTNATNVSITGVTPGGNAGGDLTGTYPNPTIVDNAVTTAKIADNAVTTAKIADNAVTNSKIADNAIGTSEVQDGAITSSKLSASGVATGTYGNATSVSQVTIDATGRVTSAANVLITGVTPGGGAGGDLTGTYPNPAIASNAVTTTKITDGAVTTTKIYDGAVTTAKMNDGAVTAAKLASTSVVPGSYGNGTTVGQFVVDAQGRITGATSVAITGAAPVGAAGGDLTGSYPNPTIAAGVVTNSKLADNAVTSTKIADNAVGTSEVIDGAVTSSKMSASGVAVGTYGNATNVSQVTVDAAGRVTSASNVLISGVTPGGGAGGDLTGTYPNPTIAANAVTATKINDNAVTTTKINDGAVTAAKLANTSVVPGSYGNGTTVGQFVVDAQGRITGATNVPITGAAPVGAAGGDLSGSYPNPAIAAGVVDNSKLSDNAVGTSKVQDGAITSSKLSASGVATGTYGNATNVSQVTIDAAGRVTSAANVLITGVTPGGSAGGDLTGTYPNPDIAANAVGNAELADNAVNTTEIVNNAVTSTKMSNTGVAVGTYGNATTVSQVTVDAAGRVTSVTNIPITGVPPSGPSGGDLTGTYPNPSIATNAVTTTKIIDGAVTTTKINDGAVTAAKLANTTVVPGSYGTGTTVGQFVVDAQGRITGATNVTITGAAPTGAAGGDLTGTYPNPTIAASAVTTTKINDGAVTAAKLANTAVVPGSYGTGTTVGQFVVDAQGRITGATSVTITGAAPTGLAGGDLTGNYPNPDIATSAVGNAELADNAVNTSEIVNNAVTSAKMSNTGVAVGTYGNATSVSQVTIDAAGRVTSATNVPITGVPPSGPSGGDLTGTYPNPTIAANAVTTTKINNGAVTALKLANTTVVPGSYGTGTTVGQFVVDAQGRITGATSVTITGAAPTGAAGGDLAGTYPNPDIAANAVGNAELANNAVTSAKMSNTGVAVGTYGNATNVSQVTVDAAGRVTSATNVPITGVPPGGASGGDLTGTYPNPTIAANAVTSTKINDNAVTTTKIIDGAVTAAKLANTAVVPGSYGNGTTVGQFVVDAQGRITGATNVTITGAAPTGAAGGDLAGTYPNPDIAANAVGNAELADNAVNTTEIVNNAVTSAKMSNTGVAVGTYGDATNVSQVTVDAAGRVTSATNVPITGVPPGGASGGDLTGTYPNPTITASAVTTTKINDGAVTAAKLANTTVVPGSYGNGTTVGQFVVDAQGRITGATNVAITGAAPTGAAGGDLAGTYPNPDIATNAVGNAELADNAVNTSEIVDNAVTSAKMSNTGVAVGTYGDATNVSQVTVDAAGRVTSATNVPITGVPPGGASGGDLTGTYPNPTIAANAVTTTKINDGAVTAAKLANTAVAAGSYGTSTTVGQFVVDAQGRITSASNVTITGATPSGTAGGDLAGTYPNPTIANTAAAGTNILSAINQGSATGTVPVARGGTGATTSSGAMNNLLPTQSGNGGKALITDGTNASWQTFVGGNALTVTKTNVEVTLPDLTGNDVTGFTFTCTGASVGATVAISPEGGMPNKIIIAWAYVSAADTVTIQVFNAGPANHDNDVIELHVTVIE